MGGIINIRSQAECTRLLPSWTCRVSEIIAKGSVKVIQTISITPTSIKKTTSTLTLLTRNNLQLTTSNKCSPTPGTITPPPTNTSPSTTSPPLTRTQLILTLAANTPSNAPREIIPSHNPTTNTHTPTTPTLGTGTKSSTTPPTPSPSSHPSNTNPPSS